MPASVRRSNLAGADVLRQASWPSNKKGWLMNCAICGKDNQAGTRFCVHCGAALALPAGGSQQSTIETAGAILAPKRPSMPGVPPAPTPPMASGLPPAAPLLPQSPPSPPPASSGATVPPYTPRAASPPPPPAERTFATREVDPAPPIPVYNAEPKKAGGIVIAIAVAGFVAAAGYIGYKTMNGASTTKDMLTRIETPPPAATHTAPSAPAAETRPPVIAEAPKSAPEPPPPPVETVAAPESRQVVPVAPPRAEPKASRASPSGPSTSRPPVTPQVTTPVIPSPAPAPPVRTAQPAITAAAAPLTDRWTQFAEDLHRCERESFLSRVVCDQRVRLR